MRIAWFSTGKGEGSKGLLKYVKEEKNLDITYVFCNRERGEYEPTDEFLDMVKEYGIPSIQVSSKKFKPELWKNDRKKWREKYDKKIIKAIPKMDIGVLAGYMLVTGKNLCNKYDLINLHPSLPGGPKGTWQEVIRGMIKADESEHGVMMHLVTPELDRGPVITYCKFKIKGDEIGILWENYYKKRKEKSLKESIKEEDENEPLFKEIRRRGFIREKPLIYHTLNSFIKKEIMIKNKTLIANGKILEKGYDLTELIDKEVN